MHSINNSNISELEMEIAEPNESSWYDDEDRVVTRMLMAVLPFCILIGLVLNIFALVVLFKVRLGSPPGHIVYLSALLVTNVFVILCSSLPYWIAVFDHSLYIASQSGFLCHFWPYLRFIIMTVSRWLPVALLADVYLADERAWGISRIPLPGTSVMRAKIVVGMIVVWALILNLWYPCHPRALQYDDTNRICYYDHDWYLQNSPRLVAWYFFVEFLPIIFINPVLFTLVIYKGIATSDGFSFSTFENSDIDKTSGDVAKDHVLVSLSVAALMFLLILPIAVVEMMHLTQMDYLYLSWAILLVVYESHLVFVPIACMALSNSMRQFIREEVLQKCFQRFPSLCICSLPSDTANDVIRLDEPDSTPSINDFQPGV